MNPIKLLPRRWIYFLSILTAIALLPWNPQGPFDARDGSRLVDVQLDFPWSGVFLEPLLAPAHMLLGAPDFRVALLSVVVWLVGAAAVAGVATASSWRRLGRGAAWAGFMLGAIILYVASIALLHQPAWRLAADDASRVVADLQTHTFGSHDGLVTAPQNLRWHAARGYNLIAVTEHNDPRGSFAAQALAQRQETAPAVIAGVEVSDEKDRFLLGIGLDPAVGVLPWRGNEQEYARKFIAQVHGQGGAVIALSWLLDAADVAELARLGIDAIEIANGGHPDLSEPVRAAMLAAARDQRVVLLASTDWHGWGGVARTWTLVDIPNGGQLSREARAAAVVRLLRERDQAAFTPVVAGYSGTPSLWRAVFAPWVEAVRYGAELSPARVASWWVWVLGVGAAATAIARRGWRARRVAAALLAAGFGAALAWRAWELITWGVADWQPHEYAVDMGTPALWVGLAGIAAAALLLWLERRRFRARRAVDRPAVRG